MYEKIRLILEQNTGLLCNLGNVTINNYGTLLEASIKRELTEELESLENLFDDAESKSPESIKEEFKVLCQIRQKRNQGTTLSYTARPESDCNEMYWEIAKILFEPKSLPELMEILLPDVKRVITLNTDRLLPEINEFGQHRQGLARVNIQLEEHDVKSMALTDLSIAKPSVLTRFVIDDECIFDLEQIQKFPLVLHRQLYKKLDCKKYSTVKQLLYSHNQELTRLQTHIQLFEKDGVVPLGDALEKLISVLVLSGEQFTGSGFAADKAIFACAQVRQYLDLFPKKIKKEIEAVSSNGRSIQDILAKLSKEGTSCVETAAKDLKKILIDERHVQILQYHPGLTEQQIKDIVRCYGKKQSLAIVGFDNTTELPMHLKVPLLREITIRSAEGYLDFLLALPEKEYATFFECVTILSRPPLSRYLDAVLKTLTSSQVEAFFSAIVRYPEKFGGLGAIYTLGAAVNPDVFQVVLGKILDFNQDNWPDLFPELKHYSDLVCALSVIPEKHRCKLAMKYQDFVSGLNILQVLDCLPACDRLVIAENCPRNTFDEEGVTKIADMLLPEQRLDFVLKDISKVKELEYVLPLIASEQERVATVKQHTALIKTCKDFSAILKKIPIESRCDVTDAGLRDNKIIYVHGPDFAAVLELLPEESRFQFAIKYTSSIIISYYIPRIMEALPLGSARLQYATQMLEEIRKGQYIGMQANIVSLLAPDERYYFVKAIGQIQKSSYVKILKNLKPVNRLEFALENQKNCDSDSLFSETLDALGADAYQFLTKYQGEIYNKYYPSMKKYIPEYELYTYMSSRVHDVEALIFTLSVAQPSLRFGLLTQHHHIIDQNSNFKAILALLPREHQMKFVMQHTDAIFSDNLKEIANFLNPQDKLIFVKACIKDRSTLLAAIAELPNEERLEVARKYLSYLKDSLDLMSVTKLLDKQAGFDFVIESIDNLTNPEFGFNSLLKTFSRQESIAIIKQIKKNLANLFKEIVEYLGVPYGISYGLTNLQNEEHLRYMLARPGFEPLGFDRLAVARQHQSLILTSKILTRIVALLPNESRFEFATLSQHVIKDDNFCELLKLLNPEERLSFAMANRHKIVTNWQLSFIAEVLPEDKRLEFRKSCINNDDLLASAVALLPPCEVFSFAMQYKHLVLSSRALHEILKRIDNENHRRDFIYATNGKMQDNYYLSNIVKLLPQSEQLPYILRNLKDGFGVGDAISLLPKNEIAIFISKHSYLISNSRQLRYVAKFLPKEMGNNLVKSNLDKINDFETLIELSDYFTTDEFLKIAVSPNIMKDESSVVKIAHHLISKDKITIEQLYDCMVTSLERIDKQQLTYERFNEIYQHIKEGFQRQSDESHSRLETFAMRFLFSRTTSVQTKHKKSDEFFDKLHFMATESLVHKRSLKITK